MDMAATPEGSPRYRSTYRWIGSRYTIFKPCGLALCRYASPGSQTLLVDFKHCSSGGSCCSATIANSTAVETYLTGGIFERAPEQKLPIWAVLCLTLACWCYVHQKRFLSGLLIGLGFGLKLFPLLYLGYFLRKRDFKALTGGV